MNTVLVTPRLRLRPIDGGDRALYVELYSDPDVMRGIGPPLSPACASDAFETVIRRVGQPFPCDRYWVVQRGELPHDLGLVALQVRGTCGEWGAMLRGVHQARGYALETLAAVTAAAFETGAIAQMTIRSRPESAGRIGHIAVAGGYRPSPSSGGLMAWVCP